MPRAVALALAAGLVLAGCGSTVPTLPPLVTPSPTGSPTEAPTATPTATPQPTVSATPAASGSAAPSPTPAPTATPVAVQTPSAAAGDPTTCSSWSVDEAYFTAVAHSLPFGVYCAALPSGWNVSATQWAKPASGGWITISYHNRNKSQSITVGEGNFCKQVADPPNCWNSTADLGAANFGDMAGSLKKMVNGRYGVFVNANTKTGYQIVGKGMTQSAFVAMAAAMVHIPKS
jgi:hypothetical protein